MSRTGQQRTPVLTGVTRATGGSVSTRRTVLTGGSHKSRLEHTHQGLSRNQLKNLDQARSGSRYLTAAESTSPQAVRTHSSAAAGKVGSLRTLWKTNRAQTGPGSGPPGPPEQHVSTFLSC